jgi:hypothetical protein
MMRSNELELARYVAPFRLRMRNFASTKSKKRRTNSSRRGTRKARRMKKKNKKEKKKELQYT